jgi:hypothetical protein
VKWAVIYLSGYVVLVLGVLAALWNLGILATVGGTWVAIGSVIAIGFGIMIAVSGSGEKKVVEIDRS